MLVPKDRHSAEKQQVLCEALERVSLRGIEQCIHYPYILCVLYTDQYAAYEGVLPEDLHYATEKGSGRTSHIENWNDGLRQRFARFVRKSLSFSKYNVMHRLMLEWFIIEHNLRMLSPTN